MTRRWHDDYKHEFLDAVRYSYSRFSIGKPKLKRFNEASIDIDLTTYLSAFLNDNGYPLLSTSAMQCIKWCYFLENIVEVALSTKAWVTVGQLWDGEKHLFAPSWDVINDWVANGVHVDNIPSTGIPAHAWITTENGRIIDPTILSSMAGVNGGKWEQYDSQVLIGCENDIFPNHRYKPMLVGSKILDAIHRKSTVPFLASNTEELNPQVVFFL